MTPYEHREEAKRLRGEAILMHSTLWQKNEQLAKLHDHIADHCTEDDRKQWDLINAMKRGNGRTG